MYTYKKNNSSDQYANVANASTGSGMGRYLHDNRSDINYSVVQKNGSVSLTNAMSGTGVAQLVPFSNKASRYQGNVVSAQRVNGDAEFLAQLRFLGPSPDMSKSWKELREAAEIAKGITYKQWKGSLSDGALREAQHLIPASLGVQFGVPPELINSYDNGMMLLSGRTSTAGYQINKYSAQYVKAKKLRQPGFKTSKSRKSLHVGFNGRTAHPDYNKYVELKMKKIYVKGKTTKAKIADLMKRLRKKHKGPNAPPYVDKIN